MEENIANTRTISSRVCNRPRMMSEIEQLLVHIVKTTGGGGKLHLELVDRIVQHLTGFHLSALVNDAVEEVHILEYINNNLPPDSPLVVNLQEESISLECEVSKLDCSAELEDLLDQKIRFIYLGTSQNSTSQGIFFRLRLSSLKSANAQEC